METTTSHSDTPSTSPTHAPLPLAGQRVLVIGGASNLGAAIARRAVADGAHVIVAARHLAAAQAHADMLPDATAIHLDITDERSIATAAEALGPIDHIVSTAAAHHNVPLADLEHERIVTAFEAKVIGPMLVAKHFGPHLSSAGSITLFSGVAAWKPAAGYAVMDTTNGAVAFLASHLAIELAPVRVNAISPGIIDSGTWDALGDDTKAAFLSSVASTNPVGRVGATRDIVDAVAWLMTAGFVTGETLHIEGGARHA